MINAFETLGIPLGLVFTDEALREAFRLAGKMVHPDAGGKDGEFASLREAFAVVSSPSRRLRHWLEWRGITAETRGAIAPSLMDFFTEIGTITQQAQAFIRRRSEAKSALVRAMLEGEAQLCRESVERLIARLEVMICHECGAFPQLEITENLDVEGASTVARSLAFLEKWRASLRAIFAQLL